MLERARTYVASELGDVPEQKQIEFVQSSAEDMGFLEDASVDLLVSCALPSLFVTPAFLTNGGQHKPLIGLTGREFGQR